MTVNRSWLKFVAAIIIIVAAILLFAGIWKTNSDIALGFVGLAVGFLA